LPDEAFLTKGKEGDESAEMGVQGKRRWTLNGRKREQRENKGNCCGTIRGEGNTESSRGSIERVAIGSCPYGEKKNRKYQPCERLVPEYWEVGNRVLMTADLWIGKV